MFNDPAWERVLQNTYGFTSERRNGLQLFRTRRGLEMNPVGDYYSIGEELTASERSAPNGFFLRLDNAIEAASFRPLFITHRLRTTGSFEDLLVHKIHQKTRNLIHKAEKVDSEIRVVSSEEGLEQFYPLYVRSLLSRNALPQTFALFKNLLKEFGPDKMRMFLIFSRAKAMAGIVALIDRKHRRLHIWANGQSKEARNLALNMATYAAVLRFACEDSEIDEVDFGNSEKDSSLAFFKGRFGGEAVPIYSNEPNFSGPSLSRRAEGFGLYVLLRLLPVSCVSHFSRFLFRYFR